MTAWPSNPDHGPGPTPGHGEPAGAPESPGSSRRPWLTRRRLVVAVAGLIALVLIGGALSSAYVGWRVAQIHRVRVEGLVPAGPSSPQNVLLAGSDSRAGESAGAAQHFGTAAQVTGRRSDVIILVHLDPRTGSASMLSIPRDLFVPIAGSASPNRINVAFDQSPGVLVKTVSQALGITINHYAEEDFSGLQGLTDAVGGVCLSFPYPVRDGAPAGAGNESGLSIPHAGQNVLHGPMALALVRSRYYQYFTNGRWHVDGTGDIGRIQRQHEYMRALAAKALHASIANPLTANAVLSRATRDVRVDTTFTNIGLVRLGLALRSVRPTAIPSWTLPYRAVNGYHGFGDVLLPDPAAQAQVVAAWQSYGAPGGGQGATGGSTQPAAPAQRAAAQPAVPSTSSAPPWDPKPC